MVDTNSALILEHIKYMIPIETLRLLTSTVRSVSSMQQFTNCTLCRHKKEKMLAAVNNDVGEAPADLQRMWSLARARSIGNHLPDISDTLEPFESAQVIWKLFIILSPIVLFGSTGLILIYNRKKVLF